MSDSSDQPDPVASPTDPDKALSVAYLRLLGASQKEAADTAGVSERTIRSWEKCSWWPDVQREAEDRWMSGLVGKARNLLLRAMSNPTGDAALALRVLERRLPELAPPQLQHQISGPDGGALPVIVVKREE